MNHFTLNSDFDELFRLCQKLKILDAAGYKEQFWIVVSKRDVPVRSSKIFTYNVFQFPMSLLTTLGLIMTVLEKTGQI